MSKIHAHIKDNETPEAVRNLMQEFVKDFESRSSDVWIREVKNRDSEHHRKTLLKQGRCDFDNPTHGLTSEDLICLYNYYYFPMHFQSSYWLFNSLWDKGFSNHFISNTLPIFIDIGCGTLSSSLAFSQTMKISSLKDIFNETLNTETYDKIPLITKNNPLTVYYLLIDVSYKINSYINSNLKDIFSLWNYGLGGRDWNCPIIMDKFEVSNLDYIDYWLEELLHRTRITENGEMGYYVNREKNISIIINLSYVLASQSFDIELFINKITRIIAKYNECNICVIYQNPDLDELNTKWEKFKQKVSLKSITKDVAPIKHYGNSKVRYEVLFKSKFDDIFDDVYVDVFIQKK